MDVRGGQEGVNARVLCTIQSFPGALDVELIRPRQRSHDGSADFRGDGPDSVKITLGSNGKARFQDVHTQAVELARHLELLFQVHAATRGLLAITQRRVKDENLFWHRTSRFE
jgi:hypothetical protein